MNVTCLSVVHGLGKIKSILVGQWTNLSGIVTSSGKSTSCHLVDSESSVKNIGWRVSSHLFKLNWDMDSEEFVQVKETTTNSD